MQIFFDKIYTNSLKTGECIKFIFLPFYKIKKKKLVVN